jgi:hypothetical protein
VYMKGLLTITQIDFIRKCQASNDDTGNFDAGTVFVYTSVIKDNEI